MAQEAPWSAAERLIILQAPGIDQDGHSSLRNPVQSHKFTKGQFQYLVTEKTSVAVYGVLGDAVQVHVFPSSAARAIISSTAKLHVHDCVNSLSCISRSAALRRSIS